MISTVCWVAKGVSKSQPEIYKDPELKVGQTFDEDESLSEEEGMDEEGKPKSIFDLYDLDNYDNEDDLPQVGNISAMAQDVTKDEYILGPVDTAAEMDDFIIRPDDFVLVAGVSEDEEVSHLDVYVYEAAQDNLYIHHDYLLPSFPLSLAWLDFPVLKDDLTATSNLIAIGSFEPYIEVWDLDVVDQPSPLSVLGGPENLDDLGTKKKLKLTAYSHKDAVLGLSWNKLQRNALASASADKTVKLWDLQYGSCIKTITHHTDKAQAVQWNPVEAPMLVSGGFDRKVIITDVRAADQISLQTELPADVESIQWLPAPHHNHFLVSMENGTVACFDILQGLKKPLWRLDAHTKPVHALTVSPIVPGLMATGSPDAEHPVKIWDISTGQPSCIYEKTTNLGPVFSLQFCGDSPFHLAVGVEGERPVILNLLDFPPVFRKYAKTYPQCQPSRQPVSITREQVAKRSKKLGTGK